MKKPDAEPGRDVDFTHAVRGAVVPLPPGKTKISIRLDNAVIEHFRAQAERAGGGNYQTLINDALVAFITQRSVLEAVRTVVREEMSGLKADIARGLEDREAGRTSEPETRAIKARGRALLAGARKAG
jgi:uncharacterized protein (DUF4415 family)